MANRGSLANIESKSEDEEDNSERSGVDKGERELGVVGRGSVDSR
ncbi:hypothetical protein ACP6PK_06630 [Dapis sp. BLCC M172]